MDYFLKNGCKYAPVELAAKFSLEYPIKEVEYDIDNCFGFHGAFSKKAIGYIKMIRQDFSIF
jgi:hypothetical protein